MQPIYFTLGANLPIMVIPDSQANADGHPVLTYTYSIYKTKHADADALVNMESNLHLTKHADPNYMGYITFEQPGKLFTYTADGQQELNSDEVQEIIETITHYRERPRMWLI